MIIFLSSCVYLGVGGNQLADFKKTVMTKDINDFITIYRQKNGKVKITYDISNESNIYKLLHELGYRYTKIDNKQVYFKRENKNLFPVKFLDISLAFRNFLRSANFINIPPDVSLDNILNWYYEKDPVKRNGLFYHHLQENLDDEEQHQLKLQSNAEYKKKFEIQELLSKFNEWNFTKTVDTVGNFGKDDDIYYKNIGENKFLVFNHYNAKKWFVSGFDCWIATFKKESNIGKKRCLLNQDIRLSFHLDRDYELIKNYVN